MKIAFKPVLLAIGFSLLPAPACYTELQAVGSIPVFEGTFVFEEGAWAEYRMTNKEDTGEYKLKISILELESHRGKQARWMEISSAAADGESAVIRLLAEETMAGPGEIFQIVVQPGGMEPFSVPAAFLKGDGSKGGQFEPMPFPEEFKSERIKYKSREIDVIEGIMTDAENNKVKIRISHQVPPIGIVSYEGPEAAMFLSDWGKDARSEISGKPAGFFGWIMSQIRNALK